jgi:hypothetical protein
LLTHGRAPKAEMGASRRGAFDGTAVQNIRMAGVQELFEKILKNSPRLQVENL